jgi:hypothetical protein
MVSRQVAERVAALERVEVELLLWIRPARSPSRRRGVIPLRRTGSGVARCRAVDADVEEAALAGHEEAESIATRAPIRAMSRFATKRISSRPSAVEADVEHVVLEHRGPALAVSP